MLLPRLINRRSLFLMLMAGAIGVPYVASKENRPPWEQIRQRLTSMGGGETLSLPSYPRPAADPAEAATTDRQASATLVGPQNVRLDQVLRFDVSPDWVTSTWSRVTPIQTGEFYGLRVPLVTGGRMDDLAGSLTYYFDDRHQVQRLTFRGVCGSEQKLVAFASKHFNLRPEPNNSTIGLYVARWNRRPTSLIRVEHATVVRADNPLAQKQVRLEINRPRAYLKMSAEMELWLAEQQPAAPKWRW